MQERVLGKAGAAGYRAGAVKLQDFVGQRVSPEWGTTRYARGLREILGPEEAVKWRREAMFLRNLQGLGRGDVLVVGEVPEGALSAWRDSTTRRVIVTGERRVHYLESHPDSAPFGSSLRDTLLNPSEVHRNRKDARMAIFYRRASDTHWYRTAVWVAPRNDRLNSVMSYRIARESEIEAGRKAGRLVWP